ncbi:MAG: 3-methyl-2-oxobutanoate hydroxymethyltransferase [Gemmatimonadales bacterium]
MSAEKALTLHDLAEAKRTGHRLVALTAYDALLGRLVDEAGVDIALVGDSVATVLAGETTTLPATLDQMIYHGRSVRRGVRRAVVVVDLPFLTYQISIEEAKRNAGRVLVETGAQAVKLEGGRSMAPTVEALVSVGIPVMGHLGFTPQSVHQLGGARVQGRSAQAADHLIEDARALEAAGAFAIVLELMPSPVAARITAAVGVPTIGIGSGPSCDGQVLVLHDMLGLNDQFKPRFLKTYAHLADTVREAARRFGQDVREGTYPDADHSFDA